MTSYLYDIQIQEAMRVAAVEKGFQSNGGKGYFKKKNEEHVIGLKEQSTQKKENINCIHILRQREKIKKEVGE